MEAHNLLYFLEWATLEWPLFSQGLHEPYAYRLQILKRWHHLHKKVHFSMFTKTFMFPKNGKDKPKMT